MVSADGKTIELIEKAITVYHNETCIKFVPRTSEQKDYISIENGQSGCWSSVGRVGGKQVPVHIRFN